jgi:hypothetical protein
MEPNIRVNRDAQRLQNANSLLVPYRIVSCICVDTLYRLLLTLRTHLFLKEGVGRKLAESVQFFTTFCGAMGYAFYADWRTSLASLSGNDSYC